MGEELERFVHTNGVTLHVIEAGPQAGPLVIFLHGFPEFWYGWRHQIASVAAAGYRVWAVDQRGYNLSEKPVGIAAYNLDVLANDIVGLIDVAGQNQATVIGHDWGAAVAWWLATRYPQRLYRLVVLNVPHPEVMWSVVARNPEQLLRSTYIAFFQVPRVPEALLSARGWDRLAQLLLKTSRPGAFSDDDLIRYRAAWSQPGAFTAMLNWYRAIVQKPPQRVHNPRITVPTLVLWGVHDAALSKELAQPSVDLCDRGKLIFFANATHWLQHEEPERVNTLIAEFLVGSFD